MIDMHFIFMTVIDKNVRINQHTYLIKYEELTNKLRILDLDSRRIDIFINFSIEFFIECIFYS